MADNVEHMLTTVDNPYDPFTQYGDWYNYDTQQGYNTVNFLARIAKTSINLSDADFEQAIEDAIDEIVSENVRGIYKKVAKQTETSSTS